MLARLMLRKLSSLVLAALLLSSVAPVAAQMNTQKDASVPASEGSAQIGTTQVPSQKVEGGQYPHQPPRMDKDVNSGPPPVPTNPAVPGTPTPTGTEAEPGPK